ncbi:unnamed protein product [Diatraea saccharalis]|uniref:Uncharacterized protein n=1 Tax=Diatraea saccharalis TaxID=40085 RepID=A0A9N9R5W8_9NEOP|nr:unnamed protein product [Diatraea saccharalis]
MLHNRTVYILPNELLPKRFPQSTSTTPKPPARTRKPSKDEKSTPEPSPAPEDQEKKPNICSRLMGKCKSKCCPCCIKGEDDDGHVEEGKGSRWNCFKKKETEDPSAVERAAGKTATIEYENETHRKRSVRELLCGCCKRQRRVSDASGLATRDVTPMSPHVVNETSCCGTRKNIERRDSILSDRPPGGCCNRLSMWARGICRRHSDQSSSRRTSMFSKNKSMSPTLPPETILYESFADKESP